MSHVKKLVIHGFKSFATKTEIYFDKGINTIIGPNGSGKSNISDALCFVLGRLSVKSMRAAKTANLIFQGSKDRKPSHEAYVEIVFDNLNKAFPIEGDELSLKRIIRKNSAGIYKINNQTKTRQEVLELLSTAGIDPNGFNIVLQGEISKFVKMRAEDRREIIEDIAGISIYESRKTKSLREIEKTEQKLKEVSAVLRERTMYLRNLEQERKQALKFKELEKTVKQCKATIINKKIDEKNKLSEELNKEVEKNDKFKEKVRIEIEKTNIDIVVREERIDEISKHIKKTTGLERENLNDEVTNLNSRIAANHARKENFEKKLADNEIRKRELNNNLQDLEVELEDLKKESPKISKRQEEIKTKKQELEVIGNEKEKLYSLETEIDNIKERIRDKEKFTERIKLDSRSLFNEIASMEEELSINNIEDCNTEINICKERIENKLKDKEKLNNTNIEFQKSLSVFESEIIRNKELKSNIPNADTCPLCQSELTETHVKNVIKDSDKNIAKSEGEILNLNKNILEVSKNIENTNIEIKNLRNNLSIKETDLINLNQINNKKSSMKKLLDSEKEILADVSKLRSTRKNLEKNLQEKEIIEERYNKLFFELQEISSRTDENINTAILFKEQETESIGNILRNIDKDYLQLNNDIKHLSDELNTDEKNLIKKQNELDELNKKFKKLYAERTDIQESIKQKNMKLVDKQNIVNRFDEAINTYKINLAKVGAEKESLEFEIAEFKDIGLLQGSIQVLQEKLEKSQNTLNVIGSVNLKALETYDAIKAEYEEVYNKAKQIETERDEILKIIEEIDRKKKKTFMKTFNSINDLFTGNFNELSVKGKAFLEIENKEDIFAGGVSIAIKVGKGKYFDVTSLSGGEQTLVALSLIFAIQEYKPYAFYILDEIDAALDKRNSELLSGLLKKYIKTGQYIIISHNDSIISNSDTIYGISMNNGVSKVLSLKIGDSLGESPIEVGK